MNVALRSLENPELRLTVRVEGSFGVLQYPLLALCGGPSGAGRRQGTERHPWLAENMVVRGFRPVRDPDPENIVLKAQPADGSIQCRVSACGLLSLLLDGNLVWSRQVDPNDLQTGLWLDAARAREVTIVSGDLISGGPGASGVSWKPEVMAKVPTIWVD